MGVDINWSSPSAHPILLWVDREIAPSIVNARKKTTTISPSSAPKSRTASSGWVPWPCQHPELAADQLADLMQRAVQRRTNLVPGERLDIADAFFLPFWKRADELEAVIFIHPWGTTLGTGYRITI